MAFNDLITYSMLTQPCCRLQCNFRFLDKLSVYFFLLEPAPLHSIQRSGVRLAPPGAFRRRGKEVVFFEAEWLGFEPPDLEHQKRTLYPLCYASPGELSV